MSTDPVEGALRSGNGQCAVTIEPCSVDDPDWLSLRRTLWPDAAEAEHRSEMASFLAEPGRFLQFLARDGSGRAVALVEASIRHDHVNGTSSSPVAFLEGLYVVPEARRRGIAARMVDAVAAWTVERGCSELASDAALANTAGQAMHEALGFRETERVVYFLKTLR